jgi:energy-coupling factor transporter ATP-binding protein EcfA2
MNQFATEGQGSLLTKNAGVRRIYVERLFGQYTYDLSDKDLPPNTATKVLLLYGDNGSGKTTILQLLFFLLSHVDRQSHKTNVTKIRFKKFAVELADGTNVVAERAQDKPGPYQLRVEREGVILAQAPYGLDEGPPANIGEMKPGDIVRHYEESAARDVEHGKLLQVLKDLHLDAIYVTDNRRVLTTIPGLRERESGHDVGVAMRAVRKGTDEGSNRGALPDAVRQISSWATRQAFKGSAQGEEDVNSAYAAIMKRLAYAPSYTTQVTDLQGVIELIKEQGRRSPDFVRFGLIKPLKVDEITEDLRAADPQTRDTMLSVLEPYVTGLRARLDALDPIRIQLSAFVDAMNSFYRNKTVHLDVDHGLTISAATGDKLSPSVLSSGEGQLLYLLASTLVAKEQSRLFMIDEPEISLNVKWQRQLLLSLLQLTADSNIQFIFATHSIELLTPYSQFVRDLNSPQQ